MVEWRPSADLAMLARRALFLADIRAFFAVRGVMEVDVPALARAAVTDPNIDSFSVAEPEKNPDYFLMTSPEYYMKRLLAAGSGAMYFLGHVFRAGDRGSRHQPEFTMLEWYRPGWQLAALQEEVAALVCTWLPDTVPQYVTYRDAFLRCTGLDPHSASLVTLKACALERLSPAFDSDDREVWIDLLFSHLVEPQLQGVVFVSEFPAAQAALARVRVDAYGNPVAERFELYIDGIEIANAYHEETAAAVLAERFRLDLEKRAGRNQWRPTIDEPFLEAMRAGLPPCSGVALGVDRLLMVVANQNSIERVVPFAL